MAGLAAAFGSGAMTNSIAEIEDAGCILVIGSNTTACHPLIGRRIIRAKEKGAKLIVADPREIHLSRFADISVRHQLGTDVALLNGIMHVIVKKNLHAENYIAERTEDFDEFMSCIEEYDPETVERITMVKAADIERMAELYACNAPASILYAMGITQHITGVDNVKSCCNLAMLSGNVGVYGGGVNPLRGQNNVQGACDMGGLPNVLPGYQPVNDREANEKFSEKWGRPVPDTAGMTITDMVKAMLDGRLKALYVIGENPKLSDPDWNHLNHALKNLDMLIVQEMFLSETAQIADVVLPASSLAEKEGTFTNTERRCMRINQALPPLADSLPDWQIICRLSELMGYPMHYEKPEQIFDEMTSLTQKSYGGMTYERLGISGLQWPCPDRSHPGTPYLHKEVFSRGKGKFHAVSYLAPAESVDERYPFLLTTGRMFAHYHFGTMTRISPHLDREQRAGYIEVHPSDARQAGISEGDLLLVSSRRGEIIAPARLSRSMRRGNLFLPIHFGENPSNVLTSSDAYEPTVKIPEYKVCSVRIQKFTEQDTDQVPEVTEESV